MTPSAPEVAAALIFALAVVHTFSVPLFSRLARRMPRHSDLLHLLAEVEVVFGLWAMVLVVVMSVLTGLGAATVYVDARDFTEPMFVFAIMVVAAARPVQQLAMDLVRVLAGLLRLPGSMGLYLVVLTVVPLLGSFITEPAAMTLAAMILAGSLFNRQVSSRLKYVTVAVLFVNVSIGGTLTNFAAPPVLMVADAWGWDLPYMASNFGWKAALATAVNALAAMLLFHFELRGLAPAVGPLTTRVPPLLVALHVLCMVGIVYFAHHQAMFMGVFLLFLGIATAYPRHQDRLMLREGLLVAFFLAGLVVLGGMQTWWLQPLLAGMSADQVFVGATLLTAFTDNAALTYLGSLVEGLSAEFKYALLAGAVTGGGLTVIANAPNPAGLSILRKHFTDGVVSPAWLVLSALLPTLVAGLAFWLL